MRNRSTYPNHIATRGRLIPDGETVTTRGLLPPESLEAESQGSSLPIRTLTTLEAVNLIPFWIRQSLRQNVRAVDRGGEVVLLQYIGTGKLTLVRPDYERFVALITEQPWVSGYDLPEPDLTQWIEASVQSVFQT